MGYNALRKSISMFEKIIDVEGYILARNTVGTSINRLVDTRMVLRYPGSTNYTVNGHIRARAGLMFDITTKGHEWLAKYAGL